MDCLYPQSEDGCSDEEECLPFEVNVKIEVDDEDNEDENMVSPSTGGMKSGEIITPDVLPHMIKVEIEDSDESEKEFVGYDNEPGTSQKGSDASTSKEDYNGFGDEKRYSLRKKISSPKTADRAEDYSNVTEIKERKKMTMKQTAVLVNFMAEHKSFALGNVKGPLGRKHHSEMWAKLCHLLALHGSSKTVVQLKKAWKDLKHKTRAKNARLGRQLSEAENKERPVIHLSSTDEKVLDLIGHKKFTSDFSRVPSEGQNDDSEDGPLWEALPVTPTEVSAGSSPMVVAEELSSVTVTRETQPSTSSPVMGLREPQTTANYYCSSQTRKKSLRERLEDVHSRIDSSEARQEGVLEAIARNLSSLAESHDSSLSLQREKLHLLQQTLQIENERLSSQLRLEEKLNGIIESQMQIASALQTFVSSSGKTKDSAQ